MRASLDLKQTLQATSPEMFFKIGIMYPKAEEITPAADRFLSEMGIGVKQKTER